MRVKQPLLSPIVAFRSMQRKLTLEFGYMPSGVLVIGSFSPDTDVYHIGLTLLDTELHDVYVQLSPATSPELWLLHLNEWPMSVSCLWPRFGPGTVH